MYIILFDLVSCVFVKIISFTSLSRLFGSYEKHQTVGGAKTGVPREKPPGTPASRTWLVSHVAIVGLELTPDTTVRRLSDYETALLTARPRGTLAYFLVIRGGQLILSTLSVPASQEINVDVRIGR